MRASRYRHAAAVFLLARPPMVREACSVLAQQGSDPYMALLVARLAERRGEGGLLLGPAARGVLSSYVLPLVHGPAAAAASGEGGALDRLSIAFVVGMWLQDRSLLVDKVAPSVSWDSLACGCGDPWAALLGCSLLRFLLLTFGQMDLLRRKALYGMCVVASHFKLDDMLQALAREYLAIACSSPRSLGGSAAGAASGFMEACARARREWRERGARTTEAAPDGFDAPPRAAGFNLAAARPAAAASALDGSETKPPPRSMLDDF